MNLEEKYLLACSTKSDINEHLPTLKSYAEENNHITEFGVRGAVSTLALLMGRPRVMVSYDINNCPVQGFAEAVKEHTDFKFIIGDTLEIKIDTTDLLFIDTLHNYNQLSKELKLHAGNVRKFIILHDTTSYEFIGESYNGVSEKGIWPAIEEFIKDNSQWSILKRYTNNNGLTILQRNV
jgi:hypothetical protein